MYTEHLQEEENFKREKKKKEKEVKVWKPSDISQTKAKSVQNAINHTAPNWTIEAEDCTSTPCSKKDQW